jgi:hypothetical protein
MPIYIVLSLLSDGFISHGKVCSIQHYLIKFVRDLRQVGRWFSLGTPVSSTNKTDRHDITEILLKETLKTITHILHRIGKCTIFYVNIFVIKMRNNKYFIDLNKGCCNLLLANHFQTWDPKLQVLVFLFLIREYRLLFTKYLILFVCFLISFESLSEKYMAFLCSYYRFDIKREKWKEIQNFNFFKFLRLFFFLLLIIGGCPF